MALLRIKKGDRAIIVSGKEKGKSGKILKVDFKEEKVLLEGLNLKKRHQRPKRGGEKGSIIQVPAYLSASKVMPECPSCKKPVRVGIKVSDSVKKRICKKCGAEF